jgi:hypothetical protein
LPFPRQEADLSDRFNEREAAWQPDFEEARIMAQPRPHVSEAIARLRLWVSVAGLIVCLAAVTQTFIYGLAHYTDVRWTSLEEAASDGKLQVVTTDGPAVSVPASELRGSRLTESGHQQAIHALEPNKARSKADVILERTNDIAAASGIVGAFSMLGLVFLGTVIGAGAKVPGVQKAATATTWAMVVFVAALPWGEVMPSVPIPGVFVKYSAVVDGTDGLTGLLLRVAIPLATATMCAVALFSFRAGVERGVIVTSVSELDEALERELSSIRRRGVAAGAAPRSMGALNRALGDAGEEEEQMPAILRAAAGAESMSRRDEPPSARRSPGDSLPRPI